MRIPLLLCGMMVAALAAGAAQAEEAKDCRLTRFSEIPITTLPDGRFTVPITLEGRTLNFLVDTGGAVATITSAQAYNLGLPVMEAAGGLRAVAGGKLSNFTRVGKISLGGIQGQNLDVFVDPELPDGADGTLAPDMMKHFDVDFDLMHGKLNLFSQKHCKGQVVYWTKSGHVVLPMDIVSSGHIEVPVSVDGIKVSALLDTGARTSVISMRALKKLGISETSPGLKEVTEAGSRYKMYDYPFQQLDFDGISVAKPRIQIVSDNFLPGRTDMLIGVTILRRLHLYIAYDEEKLYVTPAGAN